MKTQPYFTKKPETSLIAIARNMRADLLRVGWTRRLLRGGLELLLEKKGEKRYRLAAAREITAPSDIELKILLHAFGLPKTTPWSRSQVQRRKKNPDGSERVYLNALHLAECTWSATETEETPCQPPAS